jgi:ElaB/YqjD/DUF883 family membrane-anchored ribosome-binding protein
MTTQTDIKALQKDVRKLMQSVESSMSNGHSNPIGLLSQRIQDRAHDAGESVAQFISTCRQSAESIATAARDGAGEMADTAKAKATELQKESRKRITENPLTAVALSFGAGLILARLLRRG